VTAKTPLQVADGRETEEVNPSGVVLRCSVNAPIRRLLDYLPPVGWQQPVPVGTRLRVSLGNRRVVGVVLASIPRSESQVDTLKPADAVLYSQPLIDPLLLKLLGWTAEYYQHPPGEAMVLALAPRERRGEPPAPLGEPGLALNVRGRGLPDDALRRAPKQAALLALLRERPRRFSELTALGITRATARELLSKDLAEKRDISHAEDWRWGQALSPTPEQARAITQINATQGEFCCHVLEGITGSGKTEVYLQAIAATLRNGQQALVMLPEINLTPQMLQRFQSRFEAPIAVLHSGLSDGARDRHWQMARSGEAAIVIGTRSAVFVPMAKLGLIIVDEEHDGSYSQQDGLRYSARDVAVKRAQVTGCSVVLGSATPSLESIVNTRVGRYRHHQLTTRPGVATMPQKVLVDVRGLQLDAGLSKPLLDAMSATLERGEQVLLFLNRRGFAPSMLCQTCGWVAGCDNCDARLTLHRSPPGLCCHHCGARRAIPRHCPGCSGTSLSGLGLGTEQTEQALQRLFAGTTVYRADSDTMTRRSSMEDLLTAIATVGPCIILGTQLLTKGHHFPEVTCVGVLDADAQLFNPDFRGEERLAQLLTQVGGRAGRADKPGAVIIQTRHPDHPVVQSVLAEPWQTLCDELLSQRLSQGLPPHGHLAVMRCDSRATAEGLDFLTRCVRQLRTRELTEGIRIVGPLPAAMARRAGLYRSQVILMGGVRKSVHHLATQLVMIADSQKQPAGLRWFMDIDPIESL